MPPPRYANVECFKEGLRCISQLLRDSHGGGVWKSVNKAAESRATKKTKVMKSTLLLAAAAATLLTAVNTVSAAEPLLSPRAQGNQIRVVKGVSEDKLDRSLQLGSPKGRELANSLRKVPSTGPSIDLAHSPRPLLSPKNVRYDQAARELRQTGFQIAPLK